MKEKPLPDYMLDFKSQISSAENREGKGDFLAASHIYHSIADQLVSNYDDKENSAIYYKKAMKCLTKSRK